MGNKSSKKLSNDESKHSSDPSHPTAENNHNKSAHVKTTTIKPFSSNTKAKPFVSEYDAVVKIEYTIHGYTRIKYEKHSSKYVPVPIKSIIIKYCGYFFIDSSILNGNQKIILTDNILKHIIYKNNNDGIHLLYRASRDGFSEKIFHKICDDKGETVVIAQNTNNEIFGGYTDKAWKSIKNSYSYYGIRNSSNSISSNYSFIFNIINDIKIKQKHCGGIANYDYYGPCFFGNGNNLNLLDIFICGDCNINNSSHAKGILNHKQTFCIKDYEVFCLNSEYIEMYKKYTKKLNDIIQERRQQIKQNRNKYTAMPLIDGINDDDIFSLSDDDDDDIDNLDNEQQINDILKKREQKIRDKLQ